LRSHRSHREAKDGGRLLSPALAAKIPWSVRFPRTPYPVLYGDVYFGSWFWIYVCFQFAAIFKLIKTAKGSITGFVERLPWKYVMVHI